MVEDSVHRTITRQELVNNLNQQGYALRSLRNPELASVAVQNATEWYLDGVEKRLIQQRLVGRDASKMLLARLEDTEATDSVLTGKAGAGKSACVVEVVQALHERGLPVLAFRIDRIPAVSDTTKIGEYLGLEESPVLVLAAAAKTAGRSGVLIVDQVDAASAMSGRSSDTLDVIERLIQDARALQEGVRIHTVVVCRTFDWNNDPRLRRLLLDSHSQIEVTEFTMEGVEAILNSEGFDLALFRERQRQILRLPQNLSLFLEVGFDTSLAPTFGTATQLFGEYWNHKRQTIAARVAPLTDQWMAVMETLCDEITRTQQLSVPKERLDSVSPTYLHQLASEGVITSDGHRYGFGHESFFDYCFARKFFNQQQLLVSFLNESEQHLFRRAQARQVFAYLRDADSTRYVQELGAILREEGIRAHLKDLAFALLAEVTEPTEKEWMIWEEWLAPALKAIENGALNTNKLSERAWQRFFGSRSWFKFADCTGVIEGWLSSGNDQFINMAVGYLRLHQRHSPDRVAVLLEPFADYGGEEWKTRLRLIMEFADLHTSRRFFDLFLRLVANGTLDEARRRVGSNSTSWSLLYKLGENRPEWLPEVLAHRLQRGLAVVRAAGKSPNRRALFGNDDSAAKTIEKCAQHVPAIFVEHVLPVVLKIADISLTDHKPPKRDAVWSMLFNTEHPSVEDACLSGLADALAKLASEAADFLDEVILDLRTRETHVANHLLLALYGGAARSRADEAALLLSDEPWRFLCGYYDSPNWCAKCTIREVARYCTDENRGRLETAIQSYALPLKASRESLRATKRAQFTLLSAIPEELRSVGANSYFRELERRFGEPDPAPHPSSWGIVTSPIESRAAERMTDEQWLRAIAKYDREFPAFIASDSLMGGATELARELQTQVKKEPERYSRLCLRLPVNANSVYLDHSLMALKGSEVSSELVLQVCRKAFAESRGPCGKSLADVLGSITDPLPEDAIRMLHWLATEHENPETEVWQEDAGQGQKGYNGDIDTAGINSTRGRAAEAIRHLVLSDAAYVGRLLPTLRQMIQDSSASVLSCVVGALRAVCYWDPGLGMSLFKDMNLSDERLLTTYHVVRLVKAGLRERFDELRPTIERMLQSSETEVCEVGARLASIAALEHESAKGLADQALGGGPHHRLGVAQVASANIADPACRVWSEATLAILFNDDDAEVRREAASCFQKTKDEGLESYGDLIELFCSSNAFQDHPFWILDALEESLHWLPTMTCMVCESFLDRFSEEATNSGTSRFGGSDTVSKLVFRMYQQSQSGEWASRSLDLIDRLCLEGIDDVGRELEQFER